MTENEWVAHVVDLLQHRMTEIGTDLRVADGTTLPYAHEVLSYDGEGAPDQHHTMAYETDILVTELNSGDSWTPRVILEAKLRRISTHDAIIYSEKAAAHRRVHPYLRYGIFLGARGRYPLPGRLYRHGKEFDFMVSWREEDPEPSEIEALLALIDAEVRASRDLEEIVLNSRSSTRVHYTWLRRPIELRHIASHDSPIVGRLPSQET